MPGNSHTKIVLRSLLAGFVLAGLFSFGIYAFATPPGSAYDPGETLDPSCAPGDTNCTVTAQVPYTGATAALNLGSNNFTTTGTGTFGTITDGTASLTAGSLTGVKLGSLTSNGFVKTSGANGTLSIDTATYLTSTTGATTALDNLASVAINTSLISDTDNTDDLGSVTKEWKDLYVDGTAYLDAIDLNGTAITSTATQINYLASATGTTGTTSTNLVFSTSPTLVTPVLGAATGTSLALSAAANLFTATNTTDGASVQTAIFQGDRATMAANDEGYLTFRLSDDGGTQTEFGRLTWVDTDVADTTEDGRLDFAVMTAGTLADEVQLTGASFSPSTSDGNALGTASLMWSDLFLASGSVVNFDNGDVTITHAENSLTLAGGVLTIPTNGLTINATNVTSTGTQLNYLNAATGTTGTTSTNLVFSTSPTLVKPELDRKSVVSVNKVAITAPATSATLTIADGKTLTASNTITLTGTDTSSVAFCGGGTVT